MPTINRSTIIAGPCQLTFDGSTFWSKGDVTLSPEFDLFPIQTSAHGQVDSRFRAKRYEVSFEPDGRVTSALIAVMWPWTTPTIGSSIFGATDKALVIIGRDGVIITLHNARITQMPSIRMGVGVTFAGPCKFTALLANSTDPTAAAAYLTVATSGYTDTGWSASDILTQPATAAWGSSPWASFQVDSPGWEITPTLSLAPVTVDSLGVVDMTLQGLKVQAKAIPVGVTAANIIAAMSSTAALGASVSTGQELIISSGTTPKNISVIVYNAAMIDASLVWSAAKKRVAQCTWEANLSITSGIADPLFSVALS